MNSICDQGTTGHPKATCLTHFNILNNLVIIDHFAEASGPNKVCGSETNLQKGRFSGGLAGASAVK